MERNELLKQLTMQDFVSLDLALYLNTHPTCKKGMMKYNESVIAADQLRTAYERMYGPLCSYRSASRDTWTWIDNPWPWEYDFNFELCGEEM